MTVYSIRVHELQKLGVINFQNVRSCGTATAISLPCMFSMFPRNEYTERKGKEYENLTDVLTRSGIRVIWRDNDSCGSQGVAIRVKEEKLYDSFVGDMCNEGGCYDSILMKDIDERLKQEETNQNVFMVLHMKGSHGPSYYLRYPPEFRKFISECRTSDLRQCTQEEIVNTYDNTILYTDFILGQTADKLKKYISKYDVAMFYISDHGESLGEYGLYLHGMPYMIAPKEQKHVPMVMWFWENSAQNFGINLEKLREISEHSYSHDNLFHSILGLFEVETSIYEKKLDIFSKCRS